MGDALHHLIYNGGLSLTVDAAEDVHLPVQVPFDVLPPAPEGVNLYLYNIIGVFLHSILN